MGARSILPPFHINVESSETAVRSALGQLLQGLAPLKLSVDEAGTIELVMAEALNNIVEHAYPEGDAPGPIDLTCNHADGRLHLLIVDRGRAMPDEQLPEGASVNLDVDLMDMPEGGFGWFLIRDLAKDISYERRNGENRMSFSLDIEN